MMHLPPTPRARTSTLLLLTSLLATTAGAQTEGAASPSRTESSRTGPSRTEGTIDRPFLESVDVPRVLVDLVVETRGGQPVLDLRKEEVRIWEDDEEVPVIGFAPPQQEVVSSAVAPQEREGSASATRAPHTYVVFLDEIHLHPPNKKRLLKQLRETTSRLMARGDAVAVLAYDGAIRVVLGATRDVGTVRKVLADEMKSERRPLMSSMSDPRYAIELIRQRMRDNTQSLTGGGEGERGVAFDGPGRPQGTDPCVDVGGIARTNAEQAGAAASSSMNGLRFVIGTMSRYEGRKSLLYVSDGIPLVPGLEVLTYAIEMCDGTAQRQGVPYAIDTQDMGSARFTRWDPRQERATLFERDTSREWEQTAAFANAKQVSVYPFLATGLEGSRSSGIDAARTTMTFAMEADANVRDSMHLIADQTGGEAFFNSNEFADGFLDVQSEVESVYTLSFEPRQPADGREHAIRVEVDRPGTRVRYRQSYVALTTEQRLADTVLATVVHGGGANPLGVRVSSEHRDPVKGQKRVVLQVQVPLSALSMVQAAENRFGKFTVAVGGQENNGRYLPIGQKTIDVAAADVDHETQSFLYEVEVPYRRAPVKLAVAVRDEVGGEVTTIARTIEPPEEPSEAG